MGGASENSQFSPAGVAFTRAYWVGWLGLLFGLAERSLATTVVSFVSSEVSKPVQTSRRCAKTRPGIEPERLRTTARAIISCARSVLDTIWRATKCAAYDHDVH